MTQDSSSRYQLAGKVCVVTGGGSGMGREIALAMATDGAKVAVLDRDLASAEDAVRQMREAGGEGLAVACDVADPSAISEAHEAVNAAMGQADVLVNCAGVTHYMPLEDLGLDEWNRMLTINLTGTFLCCQAFGRDMLAKGDGAIINISSIAAVVSAPFYGSYPISKAGVAMLTRLLSVEWGPRGVRTNTVNPGLFYTPMSKDAYDNMEGLRKGQSSVVPVRRLGHAHELAHVVLSLASPLSSYVNGTEVTVDGGFSNTLMTVPWTEVGKMLEASESAG